MADGIALVYTLLLIFFLILTALTMIGLIVYRLNWKQKISLTTCTNNNNCPVSEVCQLNTCFSVNCSDNSNCNISEQCINNICTPQSCLFGNDCPIGSACVPDPNGLQLNACVQVGQSCTNNSECLHTSCIAGVCSQCSGDEDCPVGQGCFDLVCRYPEGVTGFTGFTGFTGDIDNFNNRLYYVSPAIDNGNIIAPPGYICPASVCGNTGIDSPYIVCGIGTVGITGEIPPAECPSSCEFCVNNVCRCKKGELYEYCKENSDCESGLCSETAIGKICVPSDDNECAFNYNGEDCLGCCNISLPYCVNGRCSLTSEGAICGSDDLPPDMCSDPASLGAIAVSGAAPLNSGYFCVNGRCTKRIGELNERCAGSERIGVCANNLLCTGAVDSPFNRCLTEIPQTIDFF